MRATAFCAVSLTPQVLSTSANTKTDKAGSLWNGEIYVLCGNFGSSLIFEAVEASV